MGKALEDRTRIRLDPSAYELRGVAASITICAKGKEQVFTSDALCSLIVRALTESMHAYGMAVLAYCLMPDHLHCVLHNQGGKSIVHAIRNFKQRTKYCTGISLWQRSFYDHFLREQEDLRKAMEYVVNNPVRAGLTADPDAYPWSHPRYNSRRQRS